MNRWQVRLAALHIPKLMERLSTAPVFMELALGEGSMFNVFLTLHSTRDMDASIMQIGQIDDQQYWATADIPGIPEGGAALVVAVEGMGCMVVTLDVSPANVPIDPGYVSQKLGLRSITTAAGFAYLLSMIRASWVGVDMAEAVAWMRQPFARAWAQYDELPPLLVAEGELGDD
jgi:hypothetical protein